MTNKKQKLELTWIGKENRPKLEPRILLEDPEKTYHAPHQITKKDVFYNKLIFGDNLLALKALEHDFASKVKCVFIDPPYNTGSAFEHYDDGIEHSLWLSLMRDRLEIIRRLLSDDGSLWITIDDNEAHYLKVLCDEVFGRSQFIGGVVWEKSDSPRMDAQFFSSRHDYVLSFAKNIESLTFKKLSQENEELPRHYDKKDEAGRSYYLKPLRAMGGQGDSRVARPNLFYPLIAPADGTEVYPKKQNGADGAWRWSREKVETEKERIEWRKGKAGWTPYFRIYADTSVGRPVETVWFHKDVGSNRTSKAEVKAFVKEISQFDTPKPERLIKRVLDVVTNPGDLILDSFAGSGTTGAVAHKMGRRWIMVELGEHCHTHIIPRMKKVIDGQDPGGITEAVGWKGGGGFRYYRLAPSLLEKDKWGNWVINKQYNAAMLTEALCKLEGFTYAPSDAVYWQQGHSSEQDFIYVTTQNLNHDQLQALSDEVGEGRSLLVLCSAFRGKSDRYPNLTIKKIPNAVLKRCEWGHDDYSLQVENLPKAPPKPGQQALFEDEQ
ncbi:MAG TPA: site-specific DNA-methyltransferase [Nitrospiraceae bacterium]|nr:site-specific DNA-methyltransferase [Nitrospiraceae bacterium]